MPSFKRSELNTLALAVTALAACTNSNFTGTSGKIAAPAFNTATNNSNTNAGSPNNNTDNGAVGQNIPSSGTGTSVANTAATTATTTSASAYDPCAGDPNATAAGTAAPAAQSLLFYAPASYSLTGVGSEGDSNDYVSGIVAGLSSAGWNANVITSIGDSGITFDACSLHKSFKQIWLWLPCNSAQNMDDNSFAGLMQYYNAGGGVVVMADNHFFVAGNDNTHCDPTDWLGSGGTPSDAARVTQQMGFALQASEYGGGGGAPTDTTHPLSQALQQLSPSFNWPQNVITGIPSGALWLPVAPNGSGYGALLDQTTAPPGGGVPAKLGMVITSMYKFHTSPEDDDVTAVAAIASYFDSHVQVTTAAPAVGGGAGLALTGSGTAGATPAHFDPRLYHAKTMQSSATALRQMVISGDKDLTAKGLRGLAKLGAIDLDELMAYHDDNRWLVRFSAALAAGSLPPAGTAATLRATLHAASLSPDLAIFCGRALAAAHVTDAVADLQAAARAFANAPEVPEHNVQAELQAAINDLTSRLGH